MFTSFTCQQVCSLRLSPTEWKLYFLKYLGLKPIRIFLLAFKKSVFSKGSVGHRYKNELVQLFRITRRQRLKETIDKLKGGTMHKTLLAKPTDGSWCDATLQSSIMYFIKCICLNIFWGQLTLFHSKRTNSFCIYASLNRIEQHATTKCFTICHNMHVFYALLNGFWLLKSFSRPKRCLSFRMSWGELWISQKIFRLIQNC